LAGADYVTGKTLKAEYLVVYDYYFADSGILRVKVVPWPSVVLIIGAGLILGAILLQSLLGCLVGVIFYFAIVPIANRRRARLRTLSFQELMASKNSTLIPWQSVESIRLSPKALTLRVEKEGVFHAERLSDFGGIAALSKSQLGDKAFVFPSNA
jgi:hypothetical protein